MPARYLIRYQTKISDRIHICHPPHAKRPYTGTEHTARKRSSNIPRRARSQNSRVERNGHVPQALQILFPTSSLRQRGVVLVPQLAQLSAPTALRALDRLLPGVWELMTGEESGPDVSAAGSFAGTVPPDGAPSAF